MRTRFFTSLRLRLLAVGIAGVSFSATLAATDVGPVSGGYKATDATSYSFIDVAASGGASVLTSTDDGVAALGLPFGFSFFGNVYTNLCVSSNGAAYFSATPGVCAAVADFANTDLSSTAAPGDRPSLLPLWSDLVLAGPGAGVFYQAQGNPGSRKFIVQWNNAFPLSKDTGISPNPLTFELILFETSGQILFQYKTVSLGAANLASNGAQATIGIRDTGSVDAPPAVGSGKQIAWSHKSPVVADGTAILFTSGKSTPVVTATGGQSTYDGSPHAGMGAAYGTLAELLTPVNLTYEGAAYPNSATPPVDAGSYTLTATFDGNANYSAGSKTASLVISPREQDIVFSTNPPAAVVNGAGYAVQANGGGSGNPVVFSTSTPGVCGLDQNTTVYFITVGTCTIDADQAGTNNYLVAAQKHQSFSVGQGTQSAVFVTGPSSLQYNSQTLAGASGGDGTGAYAFDAGVSNGCSVANGLVSVTNASGSCVLTATRAGDVNFLPSSPSVPFTVVLDKAAQTISFTSMPPASAVALGAAYTVSATGGGSGNAVTFSSLTGGVCTVSGSTANFLTAGTCQIAANQAGNNNYHAASQVTQNITVGLATQSPLSVTAPTSVTFGTTGTAVSSGGSGSGAVTFSAGASTGCGVAGTTVSVTDASGTCALTATKAATATYASTTSAPFAVTLNKATQTIGFTSVPPASPTIGGPTYTVSATGGASGNPVLFSSLTPDVCTVSGNVTSFVAAGSCQVAADQTGNTNYNAAAQATQTMIVAGTGAAATATTMGSDVNPSEFSDPVTFSATVRRSANNSVVTSGTVTFKEGATVLAGPIAVNASGRASFTTSSLSVGSHTISAFFNGTATNGASSTSVTQVVVKASTKTTVVSSKNPSKGKQSVTITATVTHGNKVVSTGTVTFKEGATVLAGPVGVNSSGAASFSTSTLSTGDHNIAAMYGGTVNYEASTGRVTQSVR